MIGVITTTGTGWVDDPVADSIEAIHGGDTALVATQYSYLPSWLSFVVDRSRAEDEGRMLIDAVHARIDAIPEGAPPPADAGVRREPRVAGLGGGVQLARRRAGQHRRGAVGGSAEHEPALGADRQPARPGLPEIRPTYADGLVVRFAGGGSSAVVGRTPATPWITPHVLYLQHPSDPVVWWSPDLLWSRPTGSSSPAATTCSAP